MRSIFFSLLFIVVLPSHAFDHSHQVYDDLLAVVVTQTGAKSVVDYDKLNSNPSELHAYLKQLESVSEKEFKQWTKNQQLAFLINAYNAFTLKLILDNYPGIDSIRDLGGLIFFSPWKKKFFTLFGTPRHLAYIEDNLLRKRYQEPRIHFAINCASIGCPALQKKAYVADQLEAQLEKATLEFMRDTSRNRYNPDKNRIEVSSIFKWFHDDFIKSGSLQNYVAPYITTDPMIQALLKDDPKSKNSSGGPKSKKSSGLQSLINQHAVGINYLDYDWSLNKL